MNARLRYIFNVRADRLADAINAMTARPDFHTIEHLKGSRIEIVPVSGDLTPMITWDVDSSMDYACEDTIACLTADGVINGLTTKRRI